MNLKWLQDVHVYADQTSRDVFRTECAIRVTDIGTQDSRESIRVGKWRLISFV
jgi:hypothetical protein